MIANFKAGDAVKIVDTLRAAPQVVDVATGRVVRTTKAQTIIALEDGTESRCWNRDCGLVGNRWGGMFLRHA